jgi:hypothetical protein
MESDSFITSVRPLKQKIPVKPIELYLRPEMEATDIILAKAQVVGFFLAIDF